MKVLAVLLLSGLAAGGGFGNDEWHTYMQYTTMKAHESCFGEDNMKIHTVDLKQAIAKCYQKDAPELNLPPFNSPYRFVNTMMTNAEEMEQNQMMFIFKMMMSMKQQNHNNYGDHMYQSRPYSMNYDSDSWMEKMMKKIAMKKMFEKMSSHQNMDFDMYNKQSQYKNMFDFDNHDNMFDMYKDNKFDMMDFTQSRNFEDKMKENMMMYKMEQMQRSDDDSSYNAYNPFNSNTYRKRMSSILHLNKRQAAGTKNADAIILPESLDIGDRLAEKLQHEQEKMESKIGNMTCVLREMGVLNQQNELDFNTQKRSLEKYSFKSKWLKNRLLEDMQVCNKVAESLPYDYQQHEHFPGLVNLAQVKTFMRCCKYSKMRSCMYKDVKEKLEKNFGPMQKILEQTQMTEDQLFPLVTQLLHGEEMEYYGY